MSIHSRFIDKASVDTLFVDEAGQLSLADVLAVAGLLLDQTYRMHPDLCRFTFETLYDGKLHGIDGLDRQPPARIRCGDRLRLPAELGRGRDAIA